MLTAAIPHMTQRHKLKSTDLQTLCFSDALSPSQIEFLSACHSLVDQKKLLQEKHIFFKDKYTALIHSKNVFEPNFSKVYKVVKDGGI